MAPTDADVEHAWRQLCHIDTQKREITGGNDGDPRFDRHLPQELVESRAETLMFLVDQTGVPAASLQSAAADAAYAHCQDPGTDFDPDRFVPPNFDRMRLMATSFPTPNDYMNGVEAGWKAPDPVTRSERMSDAGRDLDR